MTPDQTNRYSYLILTNKKFASENISNKIWNDYEGNLAFYLLNNGATLSYIDPSDADQMTLLYYLLKLFDVDLINKVYGKAGDYYSDMFVELLTNYGAKSLF